MSKKTLKAIPGVFQKEKHTILIPDLFPVHMELMAQALRTSGYRVEVLRCSGKPVLDVGLKYIHNDMCYPAICSVGQQLYAVTSGEYDLDSIALLQFQTGGGCRASNYLSVLQKALKKLKLEQIPIITLGFSNLGKGGFRVTPGMVLRLAAALTYGDLLMQLSNHVRPYEQKQGETERVVCHWNAKLKDILSGASVGLGSIQKNLRQMAADFAAVPVTKQKKAKVGIVGEVYVKYSPFANNSLEKTLQEQDCEYMLPGVLGFIHYCVSNPAVDWELFGGSRLQRIVSQLLGWGIQLYERTLAKVLKEFPRFHCPSSFQQMRAYGERILDRGVKMGEGWYLPAEIVELIESGYDSILCAQPFGCLPNHIVGRGTIRRFRELYPKAAISPIDYDASASRVNQENRIKLLLTIAKDKARACESPVTGLCSDRPG